MGRTLVLFIVTILLSCTNASAQTGSYLLKVYDPVNERTAFVNTKGDTIIPFGKYQFCTTDTFRTYAIVLLPGQGWVGIDRNEKVLYHVFVHDNGPDYESEGMFRIKENGLIGFADYATGAIVIPPKYKGAWQFENGQTRVSPDCEEKTEGDNHTMWIGGQWFHINKQGVRVD